MYEAIDQYVLGLIERSSPERTAWNLEKTRDGKKTDWNYIDGCMITALLEMADISGDARYFDFARNFINAFVGEDGSVRTFVPEKHTLDDINEGRVLFPLYDRTGDERYRLGAETLKRALDQQPRTFEGSFWHKKIYPNQVWLDGIYMAMPFLALYEKHFGGGDYADVIRQIRTVNQHMRDEKTGLYYHGYDAGKSIFWADTETGLSGNFWLRSIGWFAVALADLMEILPAEEGAALQPIFLDLMESVWQFHDGETAMYYQVPNFPGREGNYLESSGSAMLAYAMLKGARLGALPAEYADHGQATFDGIMKKYLSFDGDGTLNLGGICLVAGLGPDSDRRRDGSYAYYISEPVVCNDAKGVAPFVLCYTEIKRRQK